MGTGHPNRPPGAARLSLGLAAAACAVALLAAALIGPLTGANGPAVCTHARAEAPAAMKPYTQRIGGTDVSFDMVPIPGGKALVGSPPGEPNRAKDEGPQVEIQTQPFWIGKCEVTWAEYELWAIGLDKRLRAAAPTDKSNPNFQADAVTSATPPYGDSAFGMGKESRPAISMSQLAAKMYCKWLSVKTGRFYRLPTEAEWEYACRAGARTAYSFGNDPKLLDKYAWHAGNSQEKYHPVGTKKPNTWGVYDMHGNVAEWVLDGYAPDAYAHFKGKAAQCPLLPAAKIHPRVIRGGSYRDAAKLLRCAARGQSSPTFSERDPQFPKSIWWHTDAQFVGFRVVRPLRKPTGKAAARYGLDKPQQQDYEDDLLRRGIDP